MLKAQIQKRRREIENSLPDTLDLLSSCVSAGLGFDQGLLHVIKRTDGPLTDELAQAQREMKIPLSNFVSSSLSFFPLLHHENIM